MIDNKREIKVMEIKLKKLSFRNFKGIHSLDVDFNDDVTNVFGMNASGKSTIADGFFWLLWGKNSLNKEDFEIKPLDENGKALQKTENEVAALLLVDGRKVELKRIHREKWQKKRGEQEATFVGNETAFFWNDVPLSEKDYKAKINSILEESVFKLVTNPHYFNQLKWNERRSILMTIAGEITDDEVYERMVTTENADHLNDLTNLLQTKTLSEYKAEIGAKKKKLKDELEKIPTRIDEVNRSTPEELNWLDIAAKMSMSKIEINAIDETIQDKTKAFDEEFKKINDHNKKLNDLKTTRQNIIYRVTGEVNNFNYESGSKISLQENKIKGIKLEVEQIEGQIRFQSQEKANLNTSLEKLRAEWKELNAKQISFDDHEFTCPTCKREFDADDIQKKQEELKVNFNTEKAQLLKVNQGRGTSLKQYVEKTDLAISELKEKLATVQQVISGAQADLKILQESKEKPITVDELLDDHAEYKVLVKQIQELEAVKFETPKADIEIQKTLKAGIQADLDSLKKQLATKEQREKSQTRIKELSTEESKLAQQLADLEGIEFLIQQFTKAQIDTLEERINGKFQLVKFKMWELLINGGIEPTCECTLNGVPYSDMNSAGRIQAGIDIINVLSEYYNVHAPIFIDNRESTIEIPETQSQVINLIVVKGAKLSVNFIEFHEDFLPNKKERELIEE